MLYSERTDRHLAVILQVNFKITIIKFLNQNK